MRSEYITPFDIVGKPMKGWVLVSPDVLKTDGQLLDMLRFGVSFADRMRRILKVRISRRRWQ